ncbi:MAG: TonB-dependent receptor, partial [Bacteroidia bacterium]|nr:TonB-dependent receptor [Bacteroidia bacterium]
DNTEGGATDRSNANLSLITSFKNGALMKNQVYYCKYHFNLFSNFTFFLEDSVNGDGINQTDKGRDLFGYNGTIEKKTQIGNKSLRSVFGLGTRVDMTEIMLRHEVKRVILDTMVLGKLAEQNINAYIDETIQLSPKFSVNAALRADYFYFSFKNSLGDSLSGNSSKTKLSPKLNLYYDVKPTVRLFAHGGFGFHSNDARSVVLKLAENSLPRAIGYEAGSTFKIRKKILVNAALWGLDLENELVYVGDAGIVEINGATRRLGADLSVRCEITKYLFADADLNYSHGRFLALPEGENFIPLAPSLTSTGGLTLKQEKGFNASLRYRYINSRPANENNSVVAKGYFLLDAVINYTQSKYQIGISVENLLNSEWNQAQFDTESKLKNETQSVSELHYTPGTPFFIKGSVSYTF